MYIYIYMFVCVFKTTSNGPDHQLKRGLTQLKNWCIYFVAILISFIVLNLEYIIHFVYLMKTKQKERKSYHFEKNKYASILIITGQW